MTLINKILAIDTKNFITNKVQKKIVKLSKTYFVPTSLKYLPQNNYEMEWDLNYQEDLIKKYKQTNCLNSFNTFPKISITLSKLFPDKSHNFNFLDFGGENIDFYLDIKKNFKNIDYFVYNTESVSKNFLNLKEKYNFKNLKILKNLNEIKKHEYDFVNFGSVIQYVGNYKEVLSDIVKVSKKFVLFSGTHFYESDLNKNESLVVKQVNLLPNKFYCYFFNFNQFIETFKIQNFSVISRDRNTTDKLSYKNFKDLEKIEYTDLLLSK